MPEENLQVLPGAAFRNGKLLLFDRREILVIRQWPQIRAWRKTAGQGWHPWRPQLPRRLIRFREPQFEAARVQEEPQVQPPRCAITLDEKRARIKLLRQQKFANAAWQFSQPIPQDVRRAVRSYSESQYEMLQAFAAVDYSMELHHSNPALAYALIRNDRFRNEPPAARLAASRRWILHKQCEIAAWLGFPEDSAKACIRILAKLPVQDIRIHRLRWLRRMLSEPDLRKLFAFAPRVDAAVIGFVWDLNELLNAKLVGKLVQRMDGGALLEARMIGRDIVRMWRLLERPWPPSRKICGVNAMQALHEELWRSCQRRAESLGIEVRLAGRRLPEWPEIELLGTAKEIIAEGEAMGHCVASYILKMASGATPILLYRVLSPERATLRLSNDGEKWRIAELRCRRNRQPSLETLEFVRSWLRETQVAVEEQMLPGIESNPELWPF